MKPFLPLLIASAMLTSCATTSKSIFTGATVGGATGVIIGNQHKNKKSARVTGALVGTAFGGLVGYLAKKDKDKKRKRKLKSQPVLTSPLLTRPKIRMYWQPDQIKNNKFIEKHRIWVIESSPTWTK